VETVKATQIFVKCVPAKGIDVLQAICMDNEMVRHCFFERKV